MNEECESIAVDEPDAPEATFEHYAMLRISSKLELDLDGINSTLGVKPTHIRRRGVRPGPHGQPSPEDAWMYQPPVASEADLHCHIDALWSVLKPHAEFIRRMKPDASVTIHLGYLSRAASAGVSVPHLSLEIFHILELDFQLHITVMEDEET